MRVKSGRDWTEHGPAVRVDLVSALPTGLETRRRSQKQAYWLSERGKLSARDRKRRHRERLRVQSYEVLSTASPA